MKWTYSIPDKFKASLLLTGVIVIILFNNLSERTNTRQLKSAFESIYEDRLMAESYILELSEELHEIENRLDNQGSISPFQVDDYFQKLDQISLRYLNTKLTEEEEVHFVKFEEITWDIANGLREGTNVERQILAAFVELKELSQIQLKEAQKLMGQTGRIFSTGSLYSQFEIALLIIAGLFVQAILFASKTVKAISKVPPQLN
ncbi:MCP four helix bundle domain-containing protein [Algoriphagus boritolerans]|uniref:Four helix bundle sensory module for signal transduction n=1 Tax=Algoriphagus boritolerans DSM 17298 = JCM 18970 TaxID=1120964 RepID=A0A1H6AQQ4_9BACT|nr:hypothetical protein [Algoriphagus boritolerans]SEG50116.1 hypothetical protein SAMN03080598_04233 [Algoriphagus boritolerans DSM 17298 = JCM 18970]